MKKKTHDLQKSSSQFFNAIFINLKILGSVCDRNGKRHSFVFFLPWGGWIVNLQSVFEEMNLQLTTIT